MDVEPVLPREFTCTNLGTPPGCRAPVAKAECESWKMGLLDRFGLPPQGAYFWERYNADKKTYELAYCYDPTNSDHQIYSAITERRD